MSEDKISLRDFKTQQGFDGNFDLRKKNDSHDKLLQAVCYHLKNKKIINHEQSIDILKDFWVEEIPEYDLDRSLFIRFLKDNNISFQVPGYVIEGMGEDKQKYQIVSISEDIRKLELCIGKLYAQLKINKPEI